MLQIVADENIPFVQAAFATLGSVRLLPGRAITRALLHEADLLLVRSVTPVNAALLHGTPVKFVATATIGADHVDLDYLRHRNIQFASAAGCNANAVAEYVCAALLYWAVRRGQRLEHLTLGVVGVGNVGSKVAAKARALGLRVLLNDPPRARAEGDSSGHTFLPLQDLLRADILTLHTPLTRSGPDPTFHLIDQKILQHLRPECLLINTARGPVVDNRALKESLLRGRLAGAILDVWEGEPQIDAELVRCTTLATPHIAGYSLEGKLRATMMIYAAACRFLGVAPAWEASLFLPPVTTPRIELVPPIPASGESQLLAVIRQAYDIAADDARLRQVLADPHATLEEQGHWFDKLRHEYNYRREFANYHVAARGMAPAVLEKLRGIGFAIAA
ncbi:MAG: 4-phosphoerythronate dehydrogenase PdxB [candidate division KSB1 bacterium]|nr:4-phosphoerythronate dehydrogenase PdxB [candidate division KSB1 bacterium]MDZ7276553.1 4-phosphoerythronate dehydrogenase PdxB [candidate division KSB1 bacterium]MDZ7285028.1 4-phosphoerythronate dehydrogenase PdxB [candidate division KSB1 bacterium]MDZ7298060.1 4-phosphoerythronate dehydrogenase PdxB [candidate division KSB1 bacterium]MDZ7307448.1 4-phosphoerythronate dehydrogenase PdxB [candidate division KSB1 bacterium]